MMSWITEDRVRLQEGEAQMAICTLKLPSHFVYTHMGSALNQDTALSAFGCRKPVSFAPHPVARHSTTSSSRLPLSEMEASRRVRSTKRVMDPCRQSGWDGGSRAEIQETPRPAHQVLPTPFSWMNVRGRRHSFITCYLPSCNYGKRMVTSLPDCG